MTPSGRHRDADARLSRGQVWRLEQRGGRVWVDVGWALRHEDAEEAAAELSSGDPRGTYRIRAGRTDAVGGAGRASVCGSAAGTAGPFDVLGESTPGERASAPGDSRGSTA